MDWFKGRIRIIVNHGFSDQIWGVPVNVPLHQSIDIISGHFRNRFIGGTYHDGRMGADHEEMMNDIVCH